MKKVQIVKYFKEEETKMKELYVKAERNEPCPCGSGVKFKNCHGKNIK